MKKINKQSLLQLTKRIFVPKKRYQKQKQQNSKDLPITEKSDGNY